MGRFLSVCNQKGGVGKSTVSVNLGVGLVREGQKVLLVDVDPQGSMTASLGFVEPDDIGRTLATIMEELMNDAMAVHGRGSVTSMPWSIRFVSCVLSAELSWRPKRSTTRSH